MLFMALTFNACSQDESPVENFDKTNDAINLQKSATSDEGIEVIQQSLSENTEIYNLLTNKITIDTELLDMSKAVVNEYTFNHFYFVMIPYKNKSSHYGSLIAKSDILEFNVEENKNTLTLKDFSNETLFKVQKSNFHVDDFGLINQFNSSFGNLTTESICDCHGEESLCNHKYDRMENCGKYDYKECMVCGNDVCDQDYRCDNARTWTGPAFVIGLMATCLIS